VSQFEIPLPSSQTLTASASPLAQATACGPPDGKSQGQHRTAPCQKHQQIRHFLSSRGASCNGPRGPGLDAAASTNSAIDSISRRASVTPEAMAGVRDTTGDGVVGPACRRLCRCGPTFSFEHDFAGRSWRSCPDRCFARVGVRDPSARVAQSIWSANVHVCVRLRRAVELRADDEARDRLTPRRNATHARLHAPLLAWNVSCHQCARWMNAIQKTAHRLAPQRST